MRDEDIKTNIRLIDAEIAEMKNDLLSVKNQKIRDTISVRVAQLKAMKETYLKGLMNNGKS